MSNEIDRIIESYKRRNEYPLDRYSPLDASVNLMFQERQRALLNIFKLIGLRSLNDASVLEIGCGKGDNLL